MPTKKKIRVLNPKKRKNRKPHLGKRIHRRSKKSPIKSTERRRKRTSKNKPRNAARTRLRQKRKQPQTRSKKIVGKSRPAGRKIFENKKRFSISAFSHNAFTPESDILEFVSIASKLKRRYGKKRKNTGRLEFYFNGKSFQPFEEYEKFLNDEEYDFEKIGAAMELDSIDDLPQFLKESFERILNQSGSEGEVGIIEEIGVYAVSFTKKPSFSQERFKGIKKPKAVRRRRR